MRRCGGSHPDLLPRLYKPFYFDRQREHAPDDVMTTHHPMLEDKDGRPARAPVALPGEERP